MKHTPGTRHDIEMIGAAKALAMAVLCLLCVCEVSARPVVPQPAAVATELPASPDSLVAVDDIFPLIEGNTLDISELIQVPVDTATCIPAVKSTGRFDDYDVWEERDVEFNPNPSRAVWMSALFPGLGQVYNRRYWKLPIIVGGYLGLGYATSWNNGMLSDYTKAYRDIMDTDPTTNSYMNFFPSTIKEEDLDKTWLTNILRSRKDYFRRNRDLCIISMVGVYLIAMVDAYVDASLSHFDITPDLSVQWAPAVIHDGSGRLPSVGLNWAFNF